jgi:hypothetical protein
MISRILRHYLSRFQWEIAAFWLISVSNSFAVASDGSARLVSFLSMMEVVGIVWITICLVLAEDGFQMSGGWRTRPVSRNIQHVFPIMLAAAVIALPTVVRAVVFHRMFDADAAAWNKLWMDSLLTQGVAWFSAASALKLFGLLILRGIDGRAKTAAWSALAVILLPLTGLLCRSFASGYRAASSGGSPRQPAALSEGIKRQLPDATDFIGMWDEPVGSPDLSEARLVLKLSNEHGASSRNISVRSLRAAIKGSRIVISARVLDLDPAMAARMKRAIPVLRYEDASYGSCVEYRLIHRGARTPLLPASEWEFRADFISPLSLPEFEGRPAELLRGLELLFFIEDLTKPTFPADPRNVARNRSGNEDDDSPPFQPATLQELFARFPWSDKIWKDVARPFLILDTTDKDMPLLLDRLEFDTRLMSVFIEKGWTGAAIPVLRRLAKERIPMEVECIEILAREQDPALNDDLKMLALDHTQGLAKLEAALRPLPGFEWAAFAREAWRRQKYSNDWLEPRGEFWIIALWAAQEGDVTAFRHTAEQAARGKKWELGALKGLVAGEHPDLLAYLRENIDGMTFDPAARKWNR